MKKIFFVIIVLFGAHECVFSQSSELIIPLNHKRAIENGTRTNTGVPGPNYFQNRADYTIEVNFDPINPKISGKEKIIYENNSPDTLRYLGIRFYQNIFKPESLRNIEVNQEDFHSGVEINKLTIDGTQIDSRKFRYFGTLVFVPVPNMQMPSTKKEIQIEWSVKMPEKTNLRMGRYDSLSYFVAYWYPQISVYDDIDGWSTESYTGVHEFYNEYGNFDVSISVPKDFSVWATGTLQNAAELYSDEIVKRIEKSLKSDKLVRVITDEDYSKNVVFNKNTTGTWHFIAENVSDFAFGVSNNYLWDAVSVVVDEKTGRRAVANSVYRTEAGDGVAEIGANVLKKLSKDLIGIPYPYPHNTVWEGHGGMEFPMMCNDGPGEDLFDEVFVTSHEMSHSYFPFMVGTNETYYGWMDEGLITFIPKAIELEYGNKNAHYYVSAYGQYSMGTIKDLPLIIPSTQMTQKIYMMQNYGRSATGFYFLHNTIGDEMFKNVLKEFVTRWEGKHPLPTDFVNTLNYVTKQDWSWFWNPWFYEFGYADLALKDVMIINNELSLSVEKLGKFPVPINLTITFEDDSSEQVVENLLVWKNNDDWKFKKSVSKKIKSITLGNHDIPDANPSDNKYVF